MNEYKLRPRECRCLATFSSVVRILNHINESAICGARAQYSSAMHDLDETGKARERSVTIQ
jgi:hypothetical protein